MASPVDNLRGQQTAVTTKNDVLALLQRPKTLSGLQSVAGKILDPERLVKLAIFSVNKTPLLQRCTPQSVLGSLMLSASFGLEPNTPSQQAFLIPYKRRAKIGPGRNDWGDVFECQFQFGYRGLITLAYRSGFALRLKAEAIRSEDLFDYMEGSESFLKFKKKLTNRGPLIGAFCFTELKSGEHAATVLPAEHILKVRGKSQTYQSLVDAVNAAQSNKDREKAEARLAETPWVQWEDAMWAKTSVKAHINQLPVFDMGASILSAAADVDNSADAGLLDMADFVDPDAAKDAADGMLNPTQHDDEDEPQQQTKQVVHEQTVTTNFTATRQAEPAEVTREPPKETVRQQAPAREPQPEKAPPARAAKVAAPPPEDIPPPEDDGGFAFGNAE